jgi:hypothetical protein
MTRFLRLLVVAHATWLTSTPANAPCELCFAGKKVINSDHELMLPSGDSLTCGQAEAFARSGCWDSVRCGFMNLFSESTCCGDETPENASNETAPTTPVTCPGAGLPAESVETCYQTVDLNGGSIGFICIDSIFDMYCSATLDSAACTSCTYIMFDTICPNTGEPGKWDQDGYRLDCSNVHHTTRPLMCAKTMWLSPIIRRDNPAGPTMTTVNA